MTREKAQNTDRDVALLHTPSIYLHRAHQRYNCDYLHSMSLAVVQDDS
jgi:hypothetical protein